VVESTAKLALSATVCADTAGMEDQINATEQRNASSLFDLDFILDFFLPFS